MTARARLVGGVGVLLALVGMASPVGARRSGAPGEDAKRAEVTNEKKRLVGVWKLVACEAEGKKVPDAVLKGEVVRWRISGESVEVTVENENKGVDRYSLDPTTKPKAIDLTDKKGRRTPGIYSLDGDKLKVCINEGGKERPKDFVSKPMTHLSVWVFEREKR
jgi:uncharacterized protein (TIGR03067 family)